MHSTDSVYRRAIARALVVVVACLVALLGCSNLGPNGDVDAGKQPARNRSETQLETDLATSEVTVESSAPAVLDDVSEAQLGAALQPPPVSAPDPSDAEAQGVGEIDTLILQDPNMVTPEDVFLEVAYADMQGGADAWCVPVPRVPSDTGSCADPPPSIEAHYWHNVLGTGEALDWGESFTVESCCWGDEAVSFSLASADEQVVTAVPMDARGANRVYSLRDFWSQSTRAAYGAYTITVAGDSDSVVGELLVKAPDGPQLFPRGDDYVLAAFAPNERVRILVYDNRSGNRLLAWKDVAADQDGFYVFRLDNNGYQRHPSAAAIGQISGEAQRARGQIMSTVVSPYEVTIHSPTDEDLASLPSIWGQVDYSDPTEPADIYYEIAVEPKHELIWGFTWCTANEALLTKSLATTSFHWFIDGVEVPSDYGAGLVGIRMGSGRIPYLLHTHPVQTAGGWPCLRWSTVLTNWPTESPTELEVRYTLAAPVDDGNNTFAPGEYRQIITVKASD